MPRASVLFVLILLLFLLAGPSAAFAQRALEINDVLTETSFEHEAVPLGISRDGRLLAFPAERARASTALWILDLQTRALTNISEGLRSASNPSWSPDGQFLTFLISNTDEAATIHYYEVWIWNRADSKRQRLTGPISSPWLPGHFVWTADSKFLVTEVIPETAEVEPTKEKDEPNKKESFGTTVRVQSVNLPAALSSTVSTETSPSKWKVAPNPLLDIARIDVRTGVTDRLARNIWPLAYVAAPTGSGVALIAQDLPSSNDDLWITDPATGLLRKSVAHVAVGRAALTWSPNGQVLAVHSTNQSSSEAPKSDAGECSIFNLSTGDRSTFAAPGASESLRHMNVPLWTDESDAVLLIEHGKLTKHNLRGETLDTVSIAGSTIESLLRNQQSRRLADAMSNGRLIAVVSESNGSAMNVVAIDPVTKSTSALGSPDSSYSLDASALNPGDRSIVLGIEGPAQPFDFFKLDISTKRSERLTHLNPQYDNYVFGQVRRLPYKNASGEDRTAILLLPANYREGSRYPAIIFERDRVSASFARSFGLWSGAYNLQLYATRGCAVLYPDIAVTRTPKERVTSDVLPAIDAAVETGIVDPERLALYGHSLGGYHAMMLLVQTNRFKSAIVSEGYYNLFTLFAEKPPGGMNYTESFVTGTFGPPWQYPDRYLANSPYVQLDKLITPILLVGGSRDAYVEQGDELFEALKRAKKVVQYIRYEGEAHNANSWSLENRRDYVARTLAWFDFWLKRN